jgi:hypothetical protein
VCGPAAGSSAAAAGQWKAAHVPAAGEAAVSQVGTGGGARPEYFVATLPGAGGPTGGVSVRRAGPKGNRLKGAGAGPKDAGTESLSAVRSPRGPNSPRPPPVHLMPVAGASPMASHDYRVAPKVGRLIHGPAGQQSGGAWAQLLKDRPEILDQHSPLSSPRQRKAQLLSPREQHNLPAAVASRISTVGPRSYGASFAQPAHGGHDFIA